MFNRQTHIRYIFLVTYLLQLALWIDVYLSNIIMSYTSPRTKAHNKFCTVKQILESSPTKPLALGNVRHAVAVLMHSKVAHVTEQYDIRVLTLSVQADTAYSIVVYHHWRTLSRLVALHLSHQHTHPPQVTCNKFI